MKKIISLVVTLCLVFATFAGCKSGRPNRPDDVIIDKTKTQLYVQIYDGGAGVNWFNKAKELYEAEHPDVQIVPLDNKEEYSNILAGLQSDTSTADMFFSDKVKMQELINLNLVADITDVVTDEFETDKDGKKVSIVSKMKDDFKPIMSKDNKYYGVPYIDGISGIVYNYDLLSDKGLLNYGNGPDGKPSTYDDGLPSTMTDFWKWLARMKQSNVDPIVWTGMYDFYLQFILQALWSQYEGDDYDLNYTYNGVDTQLGAKPITAEDGYRLFAQEGRVKALDFIEKICHGNYYNSVVRDELSHTQTAGEYIFSHDPEAETSIAMLVEGIWWENENRGNFDADYGNTDYRFLPYPKMDGQASDKSHLLSFTCETAVFIKKTSSKIDLAKDFLKFTTSDKILRLFTSETGAIRPFNYELSTEEYNSLTKFGQNAWTMYNDTEHIEIVYPLSLEPMQTDSQAPENWKTKNYSMPADAFFANSAWTGTTYNDECASYMDATRWKTLYDRIYK